MKIKHFAGYGYVNARKLVKDVRDGKTTLVIEVVGDHEWGVYRDDKHDLKRWLIDRFDKDAKDVSLYDIWCSIMRDWSNEPERVVYTFTYPSKEVA